MGACVRRTKKTIDARQRKLGGEEQRGGVGSRLRHCAAPLHLVQHLEATLICQARCARWPSIQLYGRTAATALAESSAQRRRSVLGSDERMPSIARQRPTERDRQLHFQHFSAFFSIFAKHLDFYFCSASAQRLLSVCSSEADFSAFFRKSCSALLQKVPSDKIWRGYKQALWPRG